MTAADTRPGKVLVYTLGCVMELKQAGHDMRGINVSLTPKAYEYYERLKHESFYPTDDEMTEAMCIIMSGMVDEYLNEQMSESAEAWPQEIET